jgi:hypothetical protein
MALDNRLFYLGIFGVGIVVVLLIVGLYFVLKSDERSDETQDSKTTPSIDTSGAEIDSGDSNSEVNRYYLASECPQGLENKGVYGILVRNEHISDVPFDAGGGYNENWSWSHPYLCYGKAKNSDLLYLYNFTTTDTGIQVGIISDYRDPANMFASGSDYNGFWSWKHPYLQRASEPNGYYFVDVNQSGNLVGLLLKISDNNPNFASGVNYNSAWKWSHPRISK